MRLFKYDLDKGSYSQCFGEEDVLRHKNTGLFGGRQLFELVPREVVVVTKMEIK